MRLKGMDPLGDGRVGRKDIGKIIRIILDAHVHDAGGHAFDIGAAGNLEQGRDHGIRVLGQLHGAGIRQIFAAARQREPDEHGKKPREQHDHGADHQRHSAALVVSVAPAAKTEPAPNEQLAKE